MRLNKLVLIHILVAFSQYADSIEFNGFNESISILDNPMLLISVEDTVGYAPEYLVKTGNEEIYYGITSNLTRLYYIDITSNEESRKWVPDFPSGHITLAGESLVAGKYLSGAQGLDYEVPTDPLVNMVEKKPSYALSRSQGEINSVGCFQNKPLRYGDINDDDVNDIVVLSGRNVIIFSTSLNKVVYSNHYWWQDEIPTDEVEGYFPGELKDIDPQYLAESGGHVLVSRKLPARRSLTKTFFGSYAGAHTQDIIIWRKLYESNLVSDSKIGFHVLGQTMFHYQMKGGEYQLLETPQDQIQTWLSGNDLTWQKGFPTYSECEGQEGQLIPEMHDPLLNDPDVLQ